MLDDHLYSPDQSVECGWETLRSCVVSAAEETFGRERRKQPEWFTENNDKLVPLIEEKNRAFETFLRSPSLATKRSFRQLQRKVKRAVDEARESWIAKVAADGEAAVKDGKTRWESIRKLQRAFGGRKSVRPSAVKKLNGELAEGEAEVLQRWQQHFATLLNVQSSVDEEVLDAMPIHAQFCEFDDLPTEEELEEAIFKMKKGKAAGKSGILPELLL